MKTNLKQGARMHQPTAWVWVWSWRLKECFSLASAVKSLWDTGFPRPLTLRLCHADEPQWGQNCCPWLPLPGWYGCAHAWGTGQGRGLVYVCLLLQVCLIVLYDTRHPYERVFLGVVLWCAWVLSKVRSFLIFCIKSFGDCNHPQHWPRNYHFNASRRRLKWRVRWPVSHEHILGVDALHTARSLELQKLSDTLGKTTTITVTTTTVLYSWYKNA